MGASGGVPSAPDSSGVPEATISRATSSRPSAVAAAPTSGPSTSARRQGDTSEGLGQQCPGSHELSRPPNPGGRYFTVPRADMRNSGAKCAGAVTGARETAACGGGAPSAPRGSGASAVTCCARSQPAAAAAACGPPAGVHSQGGRSEGAGQWGFSSHELSSPPGLGVRYLAVPPADRRHGGARRAGAFEAAASGGAPSAQHGSGAHAGISCSGPSQSATTATPTSAPPSGDRSEGVGQWHFNSLELNRPPTQGARYLAACASPKPYGAPPSVIESFDRVKAIYIFQLVGFHQRFLRTTSPENNIHISTHLPYAAVDHGVELMMGLLLISGWLSSATWRDVGWGAHMRKKVSRLIPAYVVAVSITLLALIVMGDSWWQVLQYVLEMATLGGWSPALQWTSFNRPLWFISTLLSYHYVSPFFLPWIRRRSARQLGFLYIGFYLFRQCVGLAALLGLRELFGEEDLPHYVRIVHLWCPTQVWLPFMGAMLQQLAVKTPIPRWLTNRVAWIATDVLTLITIGLTSLVPCTGSTIADAMIAYMNLLTGPFITLLVVFLSADAGTLWYLTTSTVECRSFFGSLLSASYPLYLVHWPLVELMGEVGIFQADTWDSVLGAWACSIALSAVIDAVAIGPFTRYFVKRLSPPAEQGAKSLKPRLRQAADASQVSVIMEAAAVRDATGLFARIIALERSLYFATNGGSAMHAAHHPTDDMHEEEILEEVDYVLSNSQAVRSSNGLAPTGSHAVKSVSAALCFDPEGSRSSSERSRSARVGADERPPGAGQGLPGLGPGPPQERRG